MYCPLGGISRVQGVIVSGPPALCEVDVVVSVFVGEGKGMRKPKGVARSSGIAADYID